MFSVSNLKALFLYRLCLIKQLSIQLHLTDNAKFMVSMIKYGYMAIHFNLDKVFKVSVLLKALDSFIELIAGLLLLIISPHDIERITTSLTQHTLSVNPHNFLATTILHAGNNLAHNSRLYGGLYLLIHGVVKLAVIIGVLIQKLWAYPSLIIVLLAFIVYQLWNIIHKITLGMTLLTIFDIFIVVLTWFEWQKHKRRIRPQPTTNNN